MPVVEFALDAAAQQRVQLHIPTEPTAITVMLNNSILGSLTPEEQAIGKNFSLPDISPLHVRIFEGQPQVFRSGYPLPIIDSRWSAIDTSPAAIAQERHKKLGGCLMTWLVLNVVTTGAVTLVSFLYTLGAVVTGASPFLFLLSTLFGVIGLIGLSLIFFWKKWGFHLLAGQVVMNLLLSVPLGYFTVYLLPPVVTITVLFVYLNRSGLWQKMS